MTTSKKLKTLFEILTVVLDRVPHLIGYLDKKLIYHYVNPAYEEWFGLPAKTIVGKSMEEVFGSEVIKVIAPQIDKVLSGQVVEFERVVALKGGEMRTVQVTYIPDQNSAGEVAGFTTIVHDITQLRKNSQLLEESERRLNYALEATGEGVWDWNIQTEIVYHNQKWCDLLGLDDNFLVHTLDQFTGRIHPDDQEDVMKRLQNCLDGNAPYLSEHRMKKADGEYIWVMDRGNVVERRPDGAPLRVVGSLRDISEMKEAQARMIQASKMATLGEMAAGIAHEINNPLAIIQGSANIMFNNLEQVPPSIDSIRRGLSKIISTSERISKIVRGLKMFSRNSENDPMAIVIVKDLIDESVALCSERFKNESIKLDISSVPDCRVNGRQVQLSQVIVNLLNNALDAVSSLSEKWVRVETLIDPNGRLNISVTDSGSGVPESLRAKLMQSFFTTKGMGKGTGLGLSISKSIVQNHGGSFYLDSACSNTKFVMELPLLESVLPDQKVG